MDDTQNLSEKIKHLTSTFGEHRIKINEQLSYYVFSQIGGPADVFFTATNQKELMNILNAVNDLKIPFYILGNGTKTLVSKSGMRGIVIKNRTSALKIGAVKGKVGREGIGVEEATVEVDSGVSLGKLNEFLESQKLKTLLGVSNNPTIGGSIWIEPALIDIVFKVKVWEKGEISDIQVQDLKRDSHVVLSVILKIKASSL